MAAKEPTLDVRDERLDPAPGGRNPGRFVWVIAGIWLVYMWQPIAKAWHVQDPFSRWLAIAVVLAFAGTFIYSFARARSLRRIGDDVPTPQAIGLIGLELGLNVLMLVLLGPDAMSLLIYVAVMAMFLLPPKTGPLFVLVLIAGSYIADHLWPGAPTDFSVQFSILAGSLAMFGAVQLIRRNAQLAAARTEITRLAVAEERGRFARDLHDILGHSLTVVAVKAELAGRLVRLDPAKAEKEIGDVEGLAREALADVRIALAGYREVSLTGELANARTALDAAGIEATLPEAVDRVPADRRELFGWVVREGVTNVVRHSGAAHCTVAVSDHEVRITDDGHGPVNGSPVDSPHRRLGVGLVGLRERVEAFGATLTAGRASGGGFELRVRMES